MEAMRARALIEQIDDECVHAWGSYNDSEGRAVELAEAALTAAHAAGHAEGVKQERERCIRIMTDYLDYECRGRTWIKELAAAIRAEGSPK